MKDNEKIVETYEIMPNQYHNKKSKRLHPLVKKTGMLLLSGAILGTTAGGTFAASTYIFPQKQQSEMHKQASTNSIQDTTLTSYQNGLTNHSTANESSIQSITERCMPSIVAITNKGVTETMTLWGNMQQPSKSCGSGIIIGQSDDELLLATNFHVIEGSQTLTVVFSFDENKKNPEAVKAYVKGYDQDRDLAVIGISKKELSDSILNKMKIAVVGDSSKLSLGEQVVAIGNALGYGQSVTTGIVSALDRSITTDNSDSTSNKYIQTDAAINPGNSGGALFNMKGELVGINTAKIASSEIEGMGYAIPITDVHDLITDLMKQTARTKVYSEKERGYLGISGTDVTTDAASAYHMPKGVYVYDVEDDGAAKVAGIQKGFILTKLDGKNISSSSELQNYLKYYKAGEKVTLTAKVPDGSKYQEKQFKVTLGKNNNPTDNDSSNNNSFPQTQPSPNDTPDSNPFFFNFPGSNEIA